MQKRHAFVIRLYFQDPVAVPVFTVVVRSTVIIEQIVPVLPHPVISRFVYHTILCKSRIFLIIEYCLFRMRSEDSIRYLKEPAHLKKKCLNLLHILAPVASSDISRRGSGQHKQQDHRYCNDADLFHNNTPP